MSTIDELEASVPLFAEQLDSGQWAVMDKDRKVLFEVPNCEIAVWLTTRINESRWLLRLSMPTARGLAGALVSLEHHEYFSRDERLPSMQGFHRERADVLRNQIKGVIPDFDLLPV